MPGGDRTGPWGLGPMTGRRMGYCSGFPTPGFMYPGPGSGFGQGFGIGRGFGRSFGRGRGWQRAGFVIFGGYPYPPMMPYEYYPGMPYGHPYGMGSTPGYPRTVPNPPEAGKK